MILLSCCGDATNSLICSQAAPSKPTAIPYPKLVKRVTAHFNIPPPSWPIVMYILLHVGELLLIHHTRSLQTRGRTTMNNRTKAHKPGKSGYNHISSMQIQLNTVRVKIFASNNFRGFRECSPFANICVANITGYLCTQ